MFSYDITDILRKKLEKIGKKDKVLALNFYKKIKEIISRDEKSINMYKNLRSPLNEYKRIHLTDNYILLFKVEKNKIIFVDIKHWDDVFR
jgi:mRNA-degrading endonuclease RelE of RelBE toxin-antitoxin system